MGGRIYSLEMWQLGRLGH